MGIIQSICFCLASQTPGGGERRSDCSHHLPHVIMSYPLTMGRTASHSQTCFSLKELLIYKPFTFHFPSLRINNFFTQKWVLPTWRLTDDAIPVNLIHSTQMQFVLQLERNADCFDHRNSRDVTTQMRGERDVNKSNHCDGSFLNWTKYHSQSELGSVPPLYWVSSPSPAHTNNGYNLLLSPLSSLLFKIS